MQDVKEIISEIKEVWPECKIVHGRARHSQSQGGIERLNRTCENKLATWMTDNNSKKWSVGRMFVRWQINTTLTSDTGKKPYCLAYGQEPRVGISSLPLAPELLDSLSSEADLNKAFGLAEDAIIEEAELTAAAAAAAPFTAAPAAAAAAAPAAPAAAAAPVAAASAPPVAEVLQSRNTTPWLKTAMAQVSARTDQNDVKVSSIGSEFAVMDCDDLSDATWRRSILVRTEEDQ